MPQPKNQDEARWELVGPRELVGKGGALRRLADLYMAQHENPRITYPQALLELSQAGYASLVSTHPLSPMGGTVHSRGGGAAPRTGRAGAAGLRVSDRDGRQEQSGSKKKQAA